MKNNLLLLSALALGIVAVVVYDKKKQEPVVIQKQPEIIKPLEKPIEKKVFTFEDAVASIQESELKKDLEYLASDELEGRMSGKRGNIVAADFVKKKYESFGLPTMYHKFKIARLNPGPKNEIGDDFTQNVYAWIEGNDPKLKDEIVVVGAHMDHIGWGRSMSMAPNKIAIHPGADDNASGTVALLQIAKAFSLLKDKVPRTVVFQSYSAEEMGLIGSRYYCNNPTFPIGNPDIKKHIYMCNMDMVGRLGTAKQSVSFISGNNSPDINAHINELNGKYSFAKGITSRNSGGSDHASFNNLGINTVFLHTGMHKQYHTPDDKPNTLNYSGLESVAKYAFELNWKIAQDTNRPRFNWGEFKVMEYTHDHGHPDAEFPHHHHEDEDHE